MEPGLSSPETSPRRGRPALWQHAFDYYGDEWQPFPPRGERMWFKKKKKIKEFDPKATEFRELAPGRGGCLASKRAIVDGFGVSYFFRTEPSTKFPDSGWWFLHGTEDEAYMSDGANFD